MNSATALKTPAHPLIFALRILLIIGVPILLTLINVRLVMTPAFLSFEYNRPDFPADFYGLTREERLAYAPYAINYLLNAEDISYLGDLEFPDGTPMFNTRELRHMRDVKLVTQYAYGFAVLLGVVVIAAVLALWRSPQTRPHLRQALITASLLTLGIIFAIVVVALLNWNFFFTGFHKLFFENDTWYFAYSDTLIRLFPEQFWFDASLLVGGLSVLEALVILVITWRWTGWQRV